MSFSDFLSAHSCCRAKNSELDAEQGRLVFNSGSAYFLAPYLKSRVAQSGSLIKLLATISLLRLLIRG
jgi:hypothetical protein